MVAGKILTPFFDLKERNVGKSGFFFLENILRARIALELESADESYDQELNVYLAGLLNSLLFCGDQLQQKPYISPFDTDVQEYLSEHPGLRVTYNVYRENADTGLLFSGVFAGLDHRGSYHHRVGASRNDSDRIALYYSIAASALAHLQGNNNSLVEVLEALSEQIDVILRIVRFAAENYFDMLERISDGSFYHLQRELDMMDERREYELKLDEFLKLYGRYIERPTEGTKASLMSLAREIRRLKKDFKFDL